MFPADVQQKLIVKEEASLDHKPCANLHDPKPPHIKEEQEGVHISVRGDHEKSEQSPPFSQLYPDQIKGRELPEEKDGEQCIRIQDYGDNSLSLETQDTKKDQEDNDVKNPLSELKHLSDSGYKKCFVGKKNVDSWRKVQTGVKLSCEDCGITFIGKSDLYTHMKIHTEQKPFCCDICGKRFSKKAYLNTHMRIHTRQKPFCCDLCEQRFRQKGSLNRHMNIHTGQSPFCCDLCGKRFRQKGHFNKHMKSHTGQKPFCCDLCGQRFSEKGTLNTHMRIHSGQKPFCCDLCGKRFRQKGTLNTHLKIHREQKPFCCDLCGKRFSKKIYLNTHENPYRREAFLLSCM
uniref:C2H2-type domain-containing protein n=1 Tax=Fundulus heteroclitus TaxID=8078 RepID=A0A3Q2R2X0_FUNHE